MCIRDSPFDCKEIVVHNCVKRAQNSDGSLCIRVKQLTQEIFAKIAIRPFAIDWLGSLVSCIEKLKSEDKQKVQVNFTHLNITADHLLEGSIKGHPSCRTQDSQRQEMNVTGLNNHKGTRCEMEARLRAGGVFSQNIYFEENGDDKEAYYYGDCRLGQLEFL
eukprot:TRINITY_DN29543_c0_g1_i1.p2 TRINITY_DN29543_c0_g1~~TRINITY_DN29543_c0_g1_i1.p2  ORF type:complete len:181 (+),score=20.81 TRINITY_DN29543_c0_g1_i1:59-544(+)